MAKLLHNDSLVATVGEFAAVANITSDSSYYDYYAYVHSDLNPIIHSTGTAQFIQYRISESN